MFIAQTCIYLLPTALARNRAHTDVGILDRHRNDAVASVIDICIGIGIGIGIGVGVGVDIRYRCPCSVSASSITESIQRVARTKQLP